MYNKLSTKLYVHTSTIRNVILLLDSSHNINKLNILNNSYYLVSYTRKYRYNILLLEYNLIIFHYGLIYFQTFHISKCIHTLKRFEIE